MTKKQISAMVKKIEAHKAGIAKHRDELRDLLGDIEAICDDGDEAVNDLERTIDTLSKYL